MYLINLLVRTWKGETINIKSIKKRECLISITPIQLNASDLFNRRFNSDLNRLTKLVIVSLFSHSDPFFLEFSLSSDVNEYCVAHHNLKNNNSEEKNSTTEVTIAHHIVMPMADKKLNDEQLSYAIPLTRKQL